MPSFADQNQHLLRSGPWGWQRSFWSTWLLPHSSWGLACPSHLPPASMLPGQTRRGVWTWQCRWTQLPDLSRRLSWESKSGIFSDDRGPPAWSWAFPWLVSWQLWSSHAWRWLQFLMVWGKSYTYVWLCRGVHSASRFFILSIVRLSQCRAHRYIQLHIHNSSVWSTIRVLPTCGLGWMDIRDGFDGYMNVFSAAVRVTLYNRQKYFTKKYFQA